MNVGKAVALTAVAVVATVALHMFSCSIFALPILYIIMLAAVATAAITLVMVSANKDKWVFLRKKNGDLFGKAELAFVALGVVTLVGILLWCAYMYRLPFGIALTICLWSHEHITKALKGWYCNAKKRKKAAIEAAKNATPDAAKG